MAWEVEYTDQFEEWFDAIDGDAQERVDAAVEALTKKGPALGRPLADTLTASRHPNMKELRPPGGFLRILFAFDPRRVAILLIGGDKRGEWTEFYERMIPVADDLYDEHLAELAEESA